jgi:hypothetical protein
MRITAIKLEGEGRCIVSSASASVKKLKWVDDELHSRSLRELCELCEQPALSAPALVEMLTKADTAQVAM